MIDMKFIGKRLYNLIFDGVNSFERQDAQPQNIFSLSLSLSIASIHPSISLVFVEETNKRRKKNSGRSCFTDLYTQRKKEAILVVKPVSYRTLR